MKDTDTAFTTFMLGLILASAMWVLLYATGALDNKQTWTLSDIEGELNRRHEIAEQQVIDANNTLREIEAIR